MKNSVQVESEIDENGVQKYYDIFTNYHYTTNRFVHPHVHSFYEATLVVEGELKYTVGDHEPVTLHAGDVLFVPPYVVHETFSQRAIWVRTIVVKFSPLYLYPMETTQSDVEHLLIAPTFSKDFYLFRRGDKTATELERVMRVALAEKTEKKAGWEMALRGNLTSMYTTILRSCSNIADKEDTESEKKEDESEKNTAQELRQILVYLQENYQYNISMQEVAEVCGMSYYHFSRFFKKLTNKKFNEYLLEMRLNYAQKKLLQDNKSISEVALECGFEYVSYFIQKFKAKTGMTPKDFQKKFRLVPPEELDSSEVKEVKNERADEEA